jgi:hypothetical protein
MGALQHERSSFLPNADEALVTQWNWRCTAKTPPAGSSVIAALRYEDGKRPPSSESPGTSLSERKPRSLRKTDPAESIRRRLIGIGVVLAVLAGSTRRSWP